MNIRRLILTLSVLFFSGQVMAQDLKSFLKSCAWGTLGGAVVGTVSLAFENKPSEHMNNIARGASLGLYGGILYGMSVKDNSSTEDSSGLGIAPDLIGHGVNLAFVTRF